MKIATKPIVSLLVVMMLAAVGRAEPFPTGALLTPEMIQRIKPALGLTPDQEARMAELLREAREQGEPAAATLRTKQQALRDPAVTAETAGDLLTEVLELEGDMKHLQLRTLFALRGLLTTEQREQALRLSAQAAAGTGDLESRVRAKVARLQAAVQALGEAPTEGMKRRGEPIQALVRDGDWQAADAALDRLIADAGLDAPPEAGELPDLSGYDPGDTGLDGLRDRLEAVKQRARDIVSIPTMRRLLAARDALEAARAAQDATAVGRILTFAERELAGK